MWPEVCSEQGPMNFLSTRDNLQSMWVPCLVHTAVNSTASLPQTVEAEACTQVVHCNAWAVAPASPSPQHTHSHAVFTSSSPSQSAFFFLVSSLLIFFEMKLSNCILWLLIPKPPKLNLTRLGVASLPISPNQSKRSTSSWSPSLPMYQ